MARGLLSALWVCGFTVAGVYIITRLRGEALILANLGFSEGYLGGLVLAWCAGLEGCVLLLASLVA